MRLVIKILRKLQEKAVRWTNFETNPDVVGQLFNDSSILKLHNSFIKHKYTLCSEKLFQKENIPIFNEIYTLFNQNNVYKTRGSTNQMFSSTTNSNYPLQEHTYKSKLINAHNQFSIDIFSIKRLNNFDLFDFYCISRRSAPKSWPLNLKFFVFFYVFS